LPQGESWPFFFHPQTTDKSTEASLRGRSLARFGELFITEDLNGGNIHRLENVVTLASDKHDAFNRLQLWVEETVRLPLFI
jgi:hypothetical protein